jgi:hypothetical protein
MTSDALVDMIERKLKEYGLQKVVPDEALLGEAYRAFHRSHELRQRFRTVQGEFRKGAAEVEVPKDLQQQVRAILAKHNELRWDDAVQLVLDQTALDRVHEEKRKAKRNSGDFTDSED